ncbi:hypothetical protein COEREDRAFT_82208 [Coemansia reversa NRRL 1564]|uniref:MSP domain-containing protein n=1 Tax=Coemansia reversa (strain ATCC 12441 / NRRL 1564) TaxID=763665 RepID=A0A2G5B885_COERN|nr:hypothetical protein COEREDRAFT_82208 [Coemansia reversa NRRL 1564]|eukprot:PIA15238.1 hypothetical protein COEREDRAFT_82208 [Coemansia reversa NRRL 1564]
MASLPLIRISPSEFQFAESRTGYTSRLRLTSLQHQAVGFKFKTNAPHKFLVKPVVCSLTNKGATVDVVVKSTSPITDVDRFLIQTVALAPEEAEDLDSTKWRKLDPSRIMEDLIYCTMAQRRLSVSSVSSQGSVSPTKSSIMPAVSYVYDPYSYQEQSQYTNEKTEHKFATGLAKRLYSVLPGIDVNEISWSEFALFATTCFILGFLIPLVRLILF